MKMTKIIEKKEEKKKEMNVLGQEYKKISITLWLRFGSIVALVILMIVLVIIMAFNDDPEFTIGNKSCELASSCVNDCLNFYNEDGENHSLECEYKCLTYKYCSYG